MDHLEQESYFTLKIEFRTTDFKDYLDCHPWIVAWNYNVFFILISTFSHGRKLGKTEKFQWVFRQLAEITEILWVCCKWHCRLEKSRLRNMKLDWVWPRYFCFSWWIRNSSRIELPYISLTKKVGHICSWNRIECFCSPCRRWQCRSGQDEQKTCLYVSFFQRFFALVES